MEDLSLDIWGPRTGKSTSRVVPAILDAPGAVVSTSNKRDVVDGTRGVREVTAPVWVFDPQKIAQEEAQWWWNPLSYITDEEKAYKLTQHFAAGSRTPGSKPDAYFDPKAEDILSSYFLAAALRELPITQVYLWVTEQVSREPIEILKNHGYELQYKGLESTLELADKQRDGIFGTAEKMVQCLKSRNTLRWVAPAHGTNVATDPRRQFNPHDFAASQGTIYILSKEGAGSAAPLTTALTEQIRLRLAELLPSLEDVFIPQEVDLENPLAALDGLVAHTPDSSDVDRQVEQGKLPLGVAASVHHLNYGELLRLIAFEGVAGVGASVAG
jgi:type IV secretory pathway TraG/TraD family ATPase VirD4